MAGVFLSVSMVLLFLYLAGAADSFSGGDDERILWNLKDGSRAEYPVFSVAFVRRIFKFHNMVDKLEEIS